MFRNKLRYLLLFCVGALFSFNVQAQFSYESVIRYAFATDGSYADVTLTLTQAGTRPQIAAPGSSEFILSYNPQVFDAANVTFRQRGVWDSIASPRYYKGMTVNKGAGDYIVIRINERDTVPGSGLPNIGRGSVNTLVAVVRIPTKALPGVCGLNADIKWMAAPFATCASSPLSMIRSYRQDEADVPLRRYVVFSDQGATAYTRLSAPVPAAAFTNVSTKNKIFFTWSDQGVAANRIATRHRVYFIPDPVFNCTGSQSIVRLPDVVNANPTAPIARRSDSLNTAIVCNGVRVNRGTVRIVSISPCNDSSIATFPVFFDACYPYVFKPGFATLSTGTNKICQGDSVTVTLDTNAVRYNISGTEVPVVWRPVPASFAGWYSFDNGRTWTRNNRQTFRNLWTSGSATSAFIKVRVRDRQSCVSDSFQIEVQLNKPVDPASAPVIADKTTLENGKCTNDRVRITSNNVGDQNIPYTWRVKGNLSQLFDAATGGNVTNTGTEVYLNRPAGFFGVVVVYLENLCFGTLRDSVKITFIGTPRSGIDYLSNETGQANAVFTNADVTFSPKAFATNGPGTVYNWTFTHAGQQTNQSGTQKDYIQRFATPGTATINLRASSADGSCFSDSTITIEVIEFQQFFLPTVFSPNASDPRNKFFGIQGDNLANDGFRLVVMNRWGQVVFDSNSPSVAWDGKDQSAKECTMDTYTYSVKGKYQNGKTFEKVGIVNLVK